MSNHKPEVFLSELAQQDMDDILQYTLETWGMAQMDVYAGLLEAGFKSLQDNPRLGKSRDDWFSGCRCYQIEHHLVLYQTAEDAILVARLFHERMNPAQHL